jgi:hypothetical protein
MVAVVALAVGTTNVLAFRYMLREDNQSIVQLLSGWGRTYKPVLYDTFEPEVAVFGASWARDAFDPLEVGKLLGRKVFNHAVSGGTAYETRRFADSALGNPNLRAAIVNLDTIYGAEDAKTKYGFDEAVLNVGPDLAPNRWVSVSRVYSLVFTGWAIGTNLELVAAVRARDRGAPQSEYLPSYEQADLTARRTLVDAARARILPERGSTAGRDAARPNAVKPPSPFQLAALDELELMIDRFCERGVDVYVYFTPRHMWENNCDPDAQLARYTLELARRKQAMCPAKIGYYDFAYPNAVTLEGVASPAPAKSIYYRPDGHPRPTVGMLMAAQMFGVDAADVPAEVRRDFGVDLLRHPSPEAWLRERAARCVGVWSGDKER